MSEASDRAIVYDVRYEWDENGEKWRGSVARAVIDNGLVTLDEARSVRVLDDPSADDEQLMRHAVWYGLRESIPATARVVVVEDGLSVHLRTRVPVIGWESWD